MKLQKIVVCLMLFAAAALGQVSPCDPHLPPGSKTIVVDAFHPDAAKVVTQYPDHDEVFLVLENINPFVTNYTIKEKRTPIPETAVATFLPFIGGVASAALDTKAPASQTPATPPTPAVIPNAAAAKGKKAPPPPPPPPACQISIQELVLDKFKRLGDANSTFAKALNGVTDKYVNYQTSYQDASSAALKAKECQNIVTTANTLQTVLDGVQSPDELFFSISGEPPVTGATSITEIQSRIAALKGMAMNVRTSIAEYRRLTTGVAGCQDDLIANRKNLEDEEDWLARFVGPTFGTPTIKVYSDRATDLGNTFDKLSKARASVDQALGPKTNPFLLTHKIDGSHEDVQIDIVPASGADTSGSAPPSTKAATADGSAFTTTLHFGYGPRFNLSGGLVVSTLPQRQYTTATNTVPNSTAANMIVYQNNSSTRLSPILLLNGRLFDCDPSKSSCLWLPYLSFGITAKNDGKSTNAEYLIGPSWGLISRQLFLTVGAYAGQQQTLQGGFKVGDPTSLSSANLPITTGYHWNAGFAISWKIK